MTELLVAKALTKIKNGKMISPKEQRDCGLDIRVAMAYIVTELVDIKRIYVTPPPSRFDPGFAGVIRVVQAKMHELGSHPFVPPYNYERIERFYPGFMQCECAEPQKEVRMTLENIIKLYDETTRFPVRMSNPKEMAKIYMAAPWLFDYLASPFALLALLKKPTVEIEHHYSAIVALPDELKDKVRVAFSKGGFSRFNSWPYVPTIYREDL